MNKIEEAYEHLVDARKHIEKKWIRGALYSGGGVCALGALGKAIHGRPSMGDMAAHSCAAEFVKKGMTRVATEDNLWSAFPLEHAANGTIQSIPYFNDNLARNKKDMLKAWDYAIADAYKAKQALAKQERTKKSKRRVAK